MVKWFRSEDGICLSKCYRFQASRDPRFGSWSLHDRNDPKNTSRGLSGLKACKNKAEIICSDKEK